MIKRGPITKWFKKQLPVLTGNLLAPTGGGWEDDQYTPYATITPGPGQVQNQGLGNQWESWRLTYQVTFYAVDPDQVETTADSVREELLSKKALLRDQDFGDLIVRDLSCTQIGAIGYTKQLDPPGYSQTDVFTLEVELT